MAGMQGAFICVPGMHRQVDEWLDTMPDDVRPNQMLQLKDENAAQSVLLGAKTKRVPAEAGDLIIWDTRLPHSAASNVGDAPRVAQYSAFSDQRTGIYHVTRSRQTVLFVLTGCRCACVLSGLL